MTMTFFIWIWFWIKIEFEQMAHCFQSKQVKSMQRNSDRYLKLPYSTLHSFVNMFESPSPSQCGILITVTFFVWKWFWIKIKHLAQSFQSKQVKSMQRNSDKYLELPTPQLFCKHVLVPFPFTVWNSDYCDFLCMEMILNQNQAFGTVFSK